MLYVARSRVKLSTYRGHTSARSTRRTNVKMSLRRARTVAAGALLALLLPILAACGGAAAPAVQPTAALPTAGLAAKPTAAAPATAAPPQSTVAPAEPTA